MAFSFNTINEFVEKTPLENKTELLNLTSQAQEAYADLVSAEVNMSEIEGVIENIYETMIIISKNEVGPESVEMLGLKDQLFPHIENVSREEAMEGLGDALKKAWNKLVDWITGIFSAIWNFLRALVGLGPKTAKKCDEVVQICKENPEEAKKAIKDNKISKPVMTPEQSKANSEVQQEAIQAADELIKVQDDLEKKINEASSSKEKLDPQVLEELVTKMEALTKRVEDNETKIEEVEKAVNTDEKKTLADSKWTDPSAVVKESVGIKEAAVKDSQTFMKKMSEVSKRRERLMKILTGAAITLVCPVGGIVYTAYQLGKKNGENQPSENTDSNPTSADKPVEEKKEPKASPEFAKKLRGLVSSMGRKCASITKLFSRSRKNQEKQVDAFETVLTPVTKEEIEQADAHNTNEALKKKQEEQGLETESLKGKV